MIPNPLKAYREANGLSQEDLALKLGVSRQMIGLIETGERRITPEKALEWAEITGIPKEEMSDVFKRAAA